ncbi:MAG: PPC domain-containing DNA-binding protein [Myxococcota bacterium]
MHTIAMRLLPGKDLKRTLLELCARRDIEAACVVSCVGSVRKAIVRFADKEEGSELDGAREIVSLVGTLSRHGAHLHVSLSDGEGRVVGGHLLEGTEIHTTAEIVLGILHGMAFRRAYDERTGYKELVIDEE